VTPKIVHLLRRAMARLYIIFGLLPCNITFLRVSKVKGPSLLKLLRIFQNVSMEVSSDDYLVVVGKF
jgi:hypothetical protein